MTKRLAENDPELINAFLDVYNIPMSVVKELDEPIKIAQYFHNEIKQGMVEMGYSIDWRREFTTIDDAYSRFIEWQFKKLNSGGFITRGSHPVGWCPNDGNPVGQHDTLGDVEPDIGEYTIVKFTFDDAKLVTATLRPETIFGVTNLWINPEIEYVKISLNDEIRRLEVERAELKANANEERLRIQEEARNTRPRQPWWKRVKVGNILGGADAGVARKRAELGLSLIHI